MEKFVMPEDHDNPAVFLHYTQKQLDWQYEHAQRFPDTSVFQKDRLERSEEARKKFKGLLDIPYGPTLDEKLDIFPAETEGAPIAIFIHGGAWQRGSKENSSFGAEAFVPKGVTWIATHFTNCPPATLDEMVRQNRAAIAWVYKNAKDVFGGDPERIHVLGHSSGGHLSGMMAVTDWEGSYGLPKNLIKGSVCMSGMYDLEAVYLSYRNRYIQLTEESYKRVSAIHHIPSGYAPPLIIGCGEFDTEEFHRQPEVFLKAWKQAGHQGQFIELSGRHHFSVNNAYCEPGPLLDMIFKQIGV